VIAPAFDRATSFVRSGRRTTRRNPLLIIGVGLLLAIIGLGIFAPLLTPYDPIAQSPREILLKPGSPGHFFGTDQFGRDVYTRCLYAIRINLVIGFVGVLLPFLIGVTLGAIAGYFRGWAETIVMRMVDVITAFPAYVILIGIVAVIGPSITNLFIALAISGWTAYARLIRGEMLAIRELEYVMAARGLGFGDRRVVIRHILPNAISPAIVFAMADIVLTILATASLSYLGLGVQAPTPEWGQMIKEGQLYLLNAWWLVTIPGLFIVATGVSLSLIGDGIAARLRVGS
jgi:peptide/nickel transport system permease protein